jgi:hypothetical protein
MSSPTRRRSQSKPPREKKDAATPTITKELPDTNTNAKPIKKSSRSKSLTKPDQKGVAKPKKTTVRKKIVVKSETTESPVATEQPTEAVASATKENGIATTTTTTSTTTTPTTTATTATQSTTTPPVKPIRKLSIKKNLVAKEAQLQTEKHSMVIAYEPQLGVCKTHNFCFVSS